MAFEPIITNVPTSQTILEVHWHPESFSNIFIGMESNISHLRKRTLGNWKVSGKRIQAVLTKWALYSSNGASFLFPFFFGTLSYCIKLCIQLFYTSTILLQSLSYRKMYYIIKSDMLILLHISYCVSVMPVSGIVCLKCLHNIGPCAYIL